MLWVVIGAGKQKCLSVTIRLFYCANCGHAMLGNLACLDTPTIHVISFVSLRVHGSVRPGTQKDLDSDSNADQEYYQSGDDRSELISGSHQTGNYVSESILGSQKGRISRTAPFRVYLVNAQAHNTNDTDGSRRDNLRRQRCTMLRNMSRAASACAMGLYKSS